jgi:hypothetical protein
MQVIVLGVFELSGLFGRPDSKLCFAFFRTPALLLYRISPFLKPFANLYIPQFPSEESESHYCPNERDENNNRDRYTGNFTFEEKGQDCCPRYQGNEC